MHKNENVLLWKTITRASYTISAYIYYLVRSSDELHKGQHSFFIIFKIILFRFAIYIIITWVLNWLIYFRPLPLPLRGSRYIYIFVSMPFHLEHFWVLLLLFKVDVCCIESGQVQIWRTGEQARVKFRKPEKIKSRGINNTSSQPSHSFGRHHIG